MDVNSPSSKERKVISHQWDVMNIIPTDRVKIDSDREEYREGKLN